jgi:Trk K+ transport system NAD-binding subunit
MSPLEPIAAEPDRDRVAAGDRGRPDRGDELVGPRGATRLLAGDHVYVFLPPEEIGFVTLLFGANQMD